MTTNNDDRTPLTPPPAPGSAQPAPPTGQAPAADGGPAASRTAGFTAIGIVTAIAGGLALVGTGGTAAFATAGAMFASTDGSTAVQTVDVDGLESIRVDADASSVRVEFADVDEAELKVTNPRGPAWTFERESDELVVDSANRGWGWWFGSWFGEGEVAVITLPESLRDEAIDADLSLDAGSLDVVGDFGALAVDVNAGALDIEGSALTVDVDMSAGRADLLLDDVDEATLSVSAGDLAVRLTGTAPARTGIDVSAGSLDLTLPDAEYRIDQSIDAGSLDATVKQSSGSRNVIDVSLSAGSATIRPGR